MNKIQRAFLSVIVELSKNKEIQKPEFGDDLGYGFRNYVRKYALVNDEHHITVKAYEEISKSFDFSEPFVRGWKARKYKNIVYEHPIPAKVISKQILKYPGNVKQITNILNKADHIVIMTKSEDRELNKIYRSSMPKGWDFNIGDVFARYSSSENFELFPKKIKMQGRICV